MPILEVPAGAGVLGAMITPAVLISASGTLVLSTSNRLGRVVDRIRALGKEAEALEDAAAVLPAAPRAAERRDLIRDQLAQLLGRLKLLQTALSILYLAIGLLVAASLSVGLTASVRWGEGVIPVVFGMAGAGLLLYASTLLVRETRVAVRSTLVEIGYTRRVVDRVTRPPEATGRGVPPLA